MRSRLTGRERRPRRRFQREWISRASTASAKRTFALALPTDGSLKFRLRPLGLRRSASASAREWCIRPGTFLPPIKIPHGNHAAPARLPRAAPAPPVPRGMDSRAAAVSAQRIFALALPTDGSLKFRLRQLGPSTMGKCLLPANGVTRSLTELTLRPLSGAPRMGILGLGSRRRTVGGVSARVS